MSIKTQSLDEFYKNKSVDPHDLVHTHHFNAFSIEDRISTGVSYPTYIRRDFYKIMLFRGTGAFHYGDLSIPVQGDTLLFFNPRVPYTYDFSTTDIRGYFCVFKDEFFRAHLRQRLEEIPLFMPGAKPVFPLSKQECKEVSLLFTKMTDELNGEYVYKYELIRSYVTELIYYAMKLQPATYAARETDAATRITSVFLELLDRQFPVELSAQRILLRTPKDFADELAIHVNYLNRAVKNKTGKTTTEHIFERLAGEAKAMLRHTGMNIAEISYSLGFEDQAHFNNFFRKQVLMTPTAYRSV
ncbi:helix-turn-helix domain-containing protein [Chitinophagaceae bacterium MMS25-I14]